MKSKELVFSTAHFLILGWGMVFLYVIFNSFGALMLKNQVQHLGFWAFDSTRSVLSFFFSLLSSWKTWIGFISIVTATGAWIIALAHLELSKAYPIAIGLNLLIVLGISLFYFQEPLTFSKVFGTFFIFTGVIFLFR